MWWNPNVQRGMSWLFLENTRPPPNVAKIEFVIPKDAQCSETYTKTIFAFFFKHFSVKQNCAQCLCNLMYGKRNQTCMRYLVRGFCVPGSNPGLFSAVWIPINIQRACKFEHFLSFAKKKNCGYFCLYKHDYNVA